MTFHTLKPNEYYLDPLEPPKLSPTPPFDLSGGHG